MSVKTEPVSELERIFYEGAQRKDWHLKAFKNPKEIAEAVRDSAVKKAHVHPLRLIILGILAGIYVGFGGMFAISAAGGLGAEFAHEHPGIQKLLVGLTFPVALPLILLAGGELYTGNTMIITMGLLCRKITWKQALKVLGCAIITNFLGTHLIAGMIVSIGGYYRGSPYKEFLEYLWTAKVESPDWGQVFVRAIPANMLVCLAVMIAIGAEDIGGKMIGMWMPVMAFAVVGMEHCIANMFFLPAAIFTGSAGEYGYFLWKNLIPAILGNTLGGAFVAFCYWFVYITEDHPVKAIHKPKWMHMPHWAHLPSWHHHIDALPSPATVRRHPSDGFHQPLDAHELSHVVVHNPATHPSDLNNHQASSSSPSTSDDSKKRLTKDYDDRQHHHYVAKVKKAEKRPNHKAEHKGK